MDLIKVGKLISKLRKEKEMTQSELGNILGVSGKAVSKWERGISTPDISLLNQLSNILGITTTELLMGKQSTKKISKVKNNKIIINVIILILITLFSIGSYIVINDCYSYNFYSIKSNDNNYNIDGYLFENNNSNYLIIYNINIKDKNILNNNIDKMELILISNNKILTNKQYEFEKDDKNYNIFINLEENKRYNEEIITKQDMNNIQIVIKLVGNYEKYLEYNVPLKLIKKN